VGGTDTAARHGVLTACAPLAAPRASRGGGHPGLDSVGPEDRLIGQDPRIISRLAKGQLFVRLIQRESSDAIAKGRGRLSGSSCRVSGWSSPWRGELRGLAGVWRTQKGRINRSRWAGPDLAPCIGVRPARPVYENTCRITRERTRRGNRDSDSERVGRAKQAEAPAQVM
jgi:hypothetical protein